MDSDRSPKAFPVSGVPTALESASCLHTLPRAIDRPVRHRSKLPAALSRGYRRSLVSAWFLVNYIYREFLRGFMTRRIFHAILSIEYVKTPSFRPASDRWILIESQGWCYWGIALPWLGPAAATGRFVLLMLGSSGIAPIAPR